MRVFYENFAEQVVILFKCPKGRKVTQHFLLGESWVGNVDQKVVKFITDLFNSGFT